MLKLFHCLLCLSSPCPSLHLSSRDSSQCFPKKCTLETLLERQFRDAVEENKIKAITLIQMRDEERSGGSRVRDYPPPPDPHPSHPDPHPHNLSNASPTPRLWHWQSLPMKRLGQIQEVFRHANDLAPPWMAVTSETETILRFLALATGWTLVSFWYPQKDLENNCSELSLRVCGLSNMHSIKGWKKSGAWELDLPVVSW